VNPRRLLRTTLILAAALLLLGTAPASAKRPATKPPKPVRFVAVGTVDAVDADLSTVTFEVTGGSPRSLRHQTVTFEVSPTASIKLDDVAAELAEVEAGDHVVAKGVKNADGDWVASKLRFESPELVDGE
jgi:hypothetical protein